MGRIVVEFLRFKNDPELRYDEVDVASLRWSRGFPADEIPTLPTFPDPPPENFLSPLSADPPRELGANPLPWAFCRKALKWHPVEANVACYQNGTDDCKWRAVRFYDNKPCCETCLVYLIANEF